MNSDIDKMISGICILWNNITNSKILPHKNYIAKVFQMLDIKNKGFITFEEYFLCK